MIERIHIKNFAIIDSLELNFRNGFNVFTGETGTGKSIIVGAINLLLGERGDASVVRSDTDKALIEAEFSLSNPYTIARLKEMQIDDPSNLIIRREVYANGKSRVFINGYQESIGKLAEAGQWLLDIHGQHDHQLLLNQKFHLDILDTYGGHWQEREKVGKLYRDLINKIQFQEELKLDEQKLEQEKIFWETAVKEINEAALQTDEEDELREQFRRMENAEQISSCLEGAYHKLYSDELAVSGRLSRTISELDEIRGIDPRYGELLDILEDASAKINESVNLIAKLRDEMSYDSGLMDRITDRLELIKELKRKYRKNTIDELNKYAAECNQKLNRFENRLEELERLEKDIEELKKQLAEQALDLSRKRQATAKHLSEQVKKELKFLGMDNSEFIVNITYVKDDTSPLTFNGKSIRIGDEGIDRVEFLISTNIGEQPKPLRKIASGGEISRIMLALKSILASDDSIETLIFDEIDVGIGGITANNVAQKLVTISEQKQLIVITHLPQIAAAASTHYSVFKTTRQGKTYTSVEVLDEERRVVELARMLGGDSDTSRSHARRMLGI